MSLIDEISYKSPNAPMLSQINDIPADQFCHGDNRPPNCGSTCSCVHKVDVPLNAVVEVVLVDEGLILILLELFLNDSHETLLP